MHARQAAAGGSKRAAASGSNAVSPPVLVPFLVPAMRSSCQQTCTAQLCNLAKIGCVHSFGRACCQSCRPSRPPVPVPDQGERRVQHMPHTSPPAATASRATQRTVPSCPARNRPSWRCSTGRPRHSRSSSASARAPCFLGRPCRSWKQQKAPQNDSPGHPGRCQARLATAAGVLRLWHQCGLRKHGPQPSRRVLGGWMGAHRACHGAGMAARARKRHQ